MTEYIRDEDAPAAGALLDTDIFALTRAGSLRRTTLSDMATYCVENVEISVSDVDGLSALFDAKLSIAVASATYAPIVHSHQVGHVVGLDTRLESVEAAVAGKAAASHTHGSADVTGLDTALAGKAAASHGHAEADITGLATTLAGKAAASHTHGSADVTGLDTALAGKAAASHTHGSADVTGLDTALAGKAATSHTHAQADVTGLTTALAGKQTLDADLTAIAALTSTGLAERTNTDVWATRALGVAAATSVPTRADADARYAQLSGATFTGTVNISSGVLQVAGTQRIDAAGVGAFANNTSVNKTAADNTGTTLLSYKRGNSGDVNGALAAGSDVGWYGFYGWNGSAYVRAGYVLCRAEDAFGGSAYGTSLRFSTVTKGGTGEAVRLTLDSDGATIAGAAYATGALTGASLTINGTQRIASDGKITTPTLTAASASGSIGLFANGGNSGAYFSAYGPDNATYPGNFHFYSDIQGAAANRGAVLFGTHNGGTAYTTRVEFDLGGNLDLKTGSLKVAGTTRIASDGEITGTKFNSFTYTLADDTATSFTPPSTSGLLIVTAGGSSRYALYNYTVVSGQAANFNSVSAGVNILQTTGALTGTTGTDAKATISGHTDGKIYIENRLGASATFKVSFIAC